MGRAIAIIPARGGSKRIPRKNIKSFLGKPIISYSIEAALNSELFDVVMVSTDDEEIAEVARKCGAEVPFMRSKENSNDFAGTNDVLIEVLNEYKNRGEEFEITACIYATAPFVSTERLKQAVEMMKTHHPAVVMPMVKFSYPPQRSYHVESTGNASFIDPRYIKSRSQDLEPMYHDVGQYYVFDTNKLLELKGTIIDDIMAVVVDDIEAQDIDSLEDWELAEIKYKVIKGKQH